MRDGNYGRQEKGELGACLLHLRLPRYFSFKEQIRRGKQAYKRRDWNRQFFQGLLFQDLPGSQKANLSSARSTCFAMKPKPHLPLETRITGSFSTRFWLEMFGNSAHFPVANLLLEMFLEKPLDYLYVPYPFVIISASLGQAYWLTRWQTSVPSYRLWGNLIGPAIYTLFGILMQGLHFLSAPNHLAYWGFAFVIGSLQALRPRLPSIFKGFVIVVENMVRTAILFVMYAIFEMYTDPIQTASLSAFWDDTSHQFIGLVVLFLGAVIGLANLTADRYLGILQETSVQLKKYSEWLLGRELLSQAFVNPSAFSLTRRERTVMFMDIRGFTRWSETQSPENVVGLLTEFYRVTEAILTRHETIKFKLSADEVMAVFPTANSAIDAARELCCQVNQLLSSEHLGVGIGLHSGLLVEGLLGGRGVKFYDVIGDTVNTAKRIESAAQSGEVLISENIHDVIGQVLGSATKREIRVKGKENPVVVYSLKDRDVG